MSAISTDLPRPDRALAIGAHPDDVEFGCGATLAKWSARGTAVHLVVLTDGSKGSWDAHVDPVHLATRRVAEQEAAARVLGATSVQHLGLPDGELDPGPSTRAEVCRIIRAVRPDVVLTHDPWKRYRLHPDHRHAGFVVVDAVASARDPLYLPEHGPPHRPATLLLFEAEVVDHLERVDGWLAAKVDALLEHRSQWRSTMGIDEHASAAGVQREAFAERIRAELAGFGVALHGGLGRGLAEGFKRIDEI